LQQALDEYIGVGTDYKILRGLIKLLLDRCESCQHRRARLHRIAPRAVPASRRATSDSQR
jgi:hypothetical protein